VPTQQVRATETGSVPGFFRLPAPFNSPGSATASTDTAYFTNDTISRVMGLSYTNVLGAFFFIIEGNIIPTSQLSPLVILGWAYDGPYTNVLASPLGPGPNGFPSINPGPLFTYTGKGKIMWAEASDTIGFLVPVEFPGGAYHGCGWQWSGNVDCDFRQSVDIADITALIDNLFISRAPLCCEGEANCDGLPGIDIGDLSRLIDFLFISRTPPAPCR
jgi:hypothetical protein